MTKFFSAIAALCFCMASPFESQAQFTFSTNNGALTVTRYSGPLLVDDSFLTLFLFGRERAGNIPLLLEALSSECGFETPTHFSRHRIPLRKPHSLRGYFLPVKSFWSSE
jgi:hypothetical protein